MKCSRMCRNALRTSPCSVAIDRVDLEDLKRFLGNQEEFFIRLVENPMVLEHETFTDLILAINHLDEEMKARDSLVHLPSPTWHTSQAISSVPIHSWSLNG